MCNIYKNLLNWFIEWRSGEQQVETTGWRCRWNLNYDKLRVAGHGPGNTRARRTNTAKRAPNMPMQHIQVPVRVCAISILWNFHTNPYQSSEITTSWNNRWRPVKPQERQITICIEQGLQVWISKQYFYRYIFHTYIYTTCTIHKVMKAVVKNISLCWYWCHFAPICSLSLGSVAIRRLSPPRRHPPATPKQFLPSVHLESTHHVRRRQFF